MNGKKIKISLKDADKLEFTLLEDAKHGDYVSLKDINSFDLSPIEREINDQKNQFVLKRIQEEKKNWLNEFKTSDEFTSLQKKLSEKTQQVAILDEKLSLLSKEQKVQEENIINKFKQSQQYKDLELKIQELRAQLASKDNETKLLLENKMLKVSQDYQEQSQKLKDELNQKNQSLIDEIEKLKRIKGYHSQSIGSELEQWIQSRFNESLRNLEDCTLEKTTQAIEGTKPDFLFTILDTNKKPIASVTIEAKSENPDSKSKQKNKSFYRTLDQNRSKQKSDIAILVTEVESEDDFFIMRVPDAEYTNMYQCRPNGLIPLLSLIRLIYKKREDLLSSKGVIEFEKKQKLVEQFNDLRDNIINGSLKKASAKVEDIMKKAKKINELANDVYEDGRIVFETHLQTVQNKLEELSIKVQNKFIKEIEKLND